MSDDASTNDNNPIGQAVEVLVYAPIGLLVGGPAVLPRLVTTGRDEVARARVIGKFALQQGLKEAARTAGKLGDQAAGVLDFLGDSLSTVEPGVPGTSSAAVDGRGGARARPPERRSGSGPAAAARTGATFGAPPEAATVAAPSQAGEAHAPTVSTAPGTAGRPPAREAAPLSAAELAIPDYDGLSASHVVNRLPGLSAEELEAVRTYEAATRGRKTILNKIAQLQSG